MEGGNARREKIRCAAVLEEMGVKKAALRRAG